MKKTFLTTLLGFSALALMSSCSNLSSGGGGGGTSGVTISGAIATSPFIISSTGSKLAPRAENGTFGVTLGDLEVYVIYFSGSNVGVVKAAVDPTTGAWSFKVPVGAQINAIVRDKTSEELVGPITFVDNTTKDMSGHDKESTTYSFKDGAALGTVVLSTDGKFKVDATQPAVAQASNTTNTAPTSVLDFSGSWTLTAYTGTLPTGYGTSCAQGDMNCHGPETGEAIYLVKLVGKKFSYTGGNCALRQGNGTSSCAAPADGTEGSESVHAAQIWGGGAAIQSCNFKIGFTADDARAYGRISLTNQSLPTISGAGVVTPSPMSFGRVTFTVPTGYGGTMGGDASPNDLPWMKGGAQTQFDIMNCKTVVKTGATDGKLYNLNVCKGNLTSMGNPVGYQANGAGGCLDATTNKPVIVKNWMSLNGIMPSCTSTPNPQLPGMNLSSCTYTGVSPSVASSANFTCSNLFGTFTDASATTAAGNGVYMQSFEKIAAPATCSSIPDQLQRYKCYANAYFNDSSRNDSGCSTEFRFNWQTDSAANFVVLDGSRDKPKKQYLTSIVTYSPDGKSFTLEDEQNESVSVQLGESSIVCRIANKITIKGTAISSTQMLMDLSESAYLKDSSIPACVGEKNNADNGGSELYHRLQEGNGKYLFYLNK